MRVRRPASLTVMRTPDAMVLYDNAACRVWQSNVLADSSFTSMLMFCEEWKEYSTVVRFLASIADRSEAESRTDVDTLIVQGILETDRDQRPGTPLDGQKDFWVQHGWNEAFSFHLHTNLLPKMDYDADPKGVADKALMENYVSSESPPDNYKVIPGAKLKPLMKEVNVDQENLSTVFEDFVGANRSAGPLTFEKFAWLTHLAYGQTAVRRLPISGNHVAKTSPSGGSRHPTEVYVVVMNVTNLEPGLYHYNVKENGLEPLRWGDFSAFVHEHVITHPSRPAFPPTVAYLYTTVFERSMFRYRESRSYRVVHFDLGHLLQTTAYLASALGRSSYRGYSLHDSRVEEFLDIDGFQEAIMAFAIIG